MTPHEQAVLTGAVGGFVGAMTGQLLVPRLRAYLGQLRRRAAMFDHVRCGDEAGNLCEVHNPNWWELRRRWLYARLPRDQRGWVHFEVEGRIRVFRTRRIVTREEQWRRIRG